MGRHIQIIITIITTIGILSGMASCSSDPKPEEINYIGVREPYEEPATDYTHIAMNMRNADIDFVKNMNEASLNLFNSMLKETEGRDNFFFSPFCVNYMLSTLIDGTTPEIRDEIMNFFHHNDPYVIKHTFSYLSSKLLTLDNQVDFLIANSLWIDQNITIPSYLSNFPKEGVPMDIFRTKLRSNEAKDSINSWFEENTKGKIVELINNLPEGHVYVSSAGCIKGKWNLEFDSVSEGNFQGVSGSSTVEMMHIKRGLIYAKGENWQGVILPYGNVNYILRVILPDEGVGVAEVRGLDEEVWTPYLHVGVSLPMFEKNYENNCFEEVLKRSGIRKIFSETDWNQNIGSSEERRFSIDNWMHGASIAVDGQVAKPCTFPGPPAGWPTHINPHVDPIDKEVELIFDRPFIYEIREHSTNTLLFMGVVNNL